MSAAKRRSRRKKKNNKISKQQIIKKEQAPLISAQSIIEIITDKSLLLDKNKLFIGINVANTSNDTTEIEFNKFDNTNEYNNIVYIGINAELRTNGTKKIILYDKRDNINIDRITGSGNTKSQQLWIHIRNKYYIKTEMDTKHKEYENKFDNCDDINVSMEQQFHKETELSKNEIVLKDKLLKQVTECIYKIYSSDTIKILQFGSGALNLHTKTSDIDIAIHLNDNNNPSKYICQSMIQNLYKIMLKTFSNNGNIEMMALFSARIPIITITDTQYNIAMDIRIGNYNMIKSQELILKLLDKYDNLGYNVRNITKFVKYWAGKRNIKDLAFGYISSFGYTLMVIKFVQIMYKKNKLRRNKMNLFQLIYEFYCIYGFDFDEKTCCVKVEQNVGQLYGKNNKKSDCNLLYFDAKTTSDILEIVSTESGNGNITKGVGVKKYNKIKEEFKRVVRIIKQYKTTKQQKQSLFVMITN